MMPAVVNAPLPTTTYGRQSSIPARRDYALPPARRSGLLKTIIALLIGVILFIPGYYVVTQLWNPSFSVPQLSGGQVPTISNAVLSSITDTGVTVSWETDKPTNAQVMVCDPTGFCTWTDLKEPLVTSHRMPIDNLKADTTYHLTLLSKDADGKEASTEKDVSTLAQSDTTPPAITEIDVPTIDETIAKITWITDEPSTSQVKYGLANTYGKTSDINEELTTNHSVTLTGLESDTLYHYRVISKDISGNETTASVDNTLKTLAPLPVGIEIGNRAPDFTLETVDGEKTSLKELKGKKVVINFWATWCGPCVEEMPYFQDIATTWQGDDLVIIAINVEESTSTVKAFLENEPFTFTILLDSLGATSKKCEVSGIPKTFFIDDLGIVRDFKQTSFDSQVEIEDIIKSL
jgi:peroxiredoxin